MVKKSTPQIRELADVPDNELKDAVMDFCNRLHIHGKGDGYDLYEAVHKEKIKAKNRSYEDLLKSAG
ncbi:MAG TPA: hypothetical protein DIW44_12335 [Anaerolineaceae bacterium]|nr:hypothetical protein [Anaerolineaceae bacterium]